MISNVLRKTRTQLGPSSGLDNKECHKILQSEDSYYTKVTHKIPLGTKKEWRNCLPKDYVKNHQDDADCTRHA